MSHIYCQPMAKHGFLLRSGCTGNVFLLPCCSLFFRSWADDQRTARSILITVTVAGMVGLGRCGQYRQSHGIHGPDHLEWSGPDPPALLSSVVDTCLVQTLMSCANSAKSRPGSRTSKPNAGDQGPGIPRPNLQALVQTCLMAGTGVRRDDRRPRTVTLTITDTDPDTIHKVR